MFSSANVGTADRIIRIIIGIALAAYAYVSLGSPWSWLAYAVAAILVGTALVRYCPAYALFEANTCGTSTGQHADSASKGSSSQL